LDDTTPHTLEDIIDKEFTTEHKEALNEFVDEIRDTSNYFRKIVKEAYGILGFVKFLKGYYLILITD
jgi:hypothetical protein